MCLVNEMKGIRIMEILEWLLDIIEYILDWHGTPFVVAIIMIIAQIILCFKAKKLVIKLMPLILVLTFTVLLVIISLFFGEGSSGLLTDNVGPIVAAFFAIGAIPPLLGIGLVWLIYAFVKKIKRRKFVNSI